MGAATLAMNKGISAQWYAMTQGLAFIAAVATIAWMRKFKVVSVPELLGRVFNMPGRLFGAFVTIFGNLALTAGQTIGMASIVTVTTGIPLEIAFWMSVVVFVGVTLWGGLVGIAWVDVFQGTLIVIGLPIATFAAINNTGGWEKLNAAVPAGHTDWFGVGLVQIASWFFMYMFVVSAGQMLVQKVWAARDTKSAQWGTFAAGLFVCTVGLFSASLGLIAKAYGPPDLDPRLAFAWSITGALPEVLGGLLLAAAVSAVMTGAMSFLMAASMTLTNDIYIPLKGGYAKTSEEELLLVSRLAVIGVAAVAVVISLTGINIVPINTMGMGLMGAPVGVALLFSLWRKTARVSAIWGMLCGGAAFAYWEFVALRPWSMEPAVPAAIATAIGMVIVSYVSKGERVNLKVAEVDSASQSDLMEQRQRERVAALLTRKASIGDKG